eukprot:TRINITY_DN11518_c1_g1_i2.p1 TRINITY_DN11518_c1_g1~~TRINITY_DN11518_c1_g1_i2.p1  ORF type:complete len:748 (-),score=187.83 TRINITY_DN11518_c1_g1_i2:27-2270(-)
MDKIQDASDAEWDSCENVFCTFFGWMNSDPTRKESTNKSYLRQFITLFEEDGKSLKGMASDEYFTLTKASPKNRAGNGQRAAAVKQWIKFWADKGEELWLSNGWTDSRGDKLFISKMKAIRGPSTDASKPSKAKEEKVKDEKVKEEKVKEEIVKQEKRQDTKDVKEEPPAKSRKIEEEDDVNRGLMEFMGEMMDSEEPRRRKHEHKSKKHTEESHDGAGDGVQTFPPVTRVDLEVETDTEYPECDLESSPKVLITENSGTKLDGHYDRIQWSSRGRPCWAMRSGKKRFYLYWNSGWKFNTVFGLSKSLAHCKDAKGVMCPCEPFPFVWKVYSKETQGFTKALALRVYDAEAAEEETALLGDLLAPLLAEPSESGVPKHGSNEAKASRSDRMADNAKPSSDAKTTKEAKRAETEQKGDQKAEADDEKSEAPDEDSASSSEEDSSSDSESSSSEGGGSEQPTKPTTPPQAPTPPTAQTCWKCGVKSTGAKFCTECGAKKDAAPPPPPPQAAKPTKPAAPPPGAATTASKNPEKARLFEQKLRSTLAPLVGKAGELKQKLEYITSSVRTKIDTFVAISGLSPQKLNELADTLEKEFLPAATPKHPSAPPPQRLLDAKHPSGPPPRHLLEKRQEQAGEEEPAPTTPPEAQNGGKYGHHRTAEPARSALASRWAPKRTSNRIMYLADENFVQLTDVVTHKAMGEQLWFSAPGALVVCDSCERRVPQGCGRLQGSPMRSQFAQNEFYCSDCTG